MRLSISWIFIGLLANLASPWTIQRVSCPTKPDVTWDYLQVVSVRLQHGTKLASLCLQCKDYNANIKVDKSTSICWKMQFQMRHLKNLLKITPSSEILSSVYTFSCTKQTLKEFLTTDDISTGEVCESYISQGNDQVVVLYHSPNDTAVMTASDQTDDVQSLFGVNWRSIWMKIGIAFIISNVLLCLVIGTIIGSFYHEKRLEELWRISMTLPHYCMDKTRLHFQISRLVQGECTTTAGTYLTHDMAISSLSISQNNEKLDDNEEETRFNVDLERVQIVNYTPQSSIEC